MTLRSRMRTLEAAASKSRRMPAAEPRDEDAWAAYYKEQGRAGTFDHEPDFPRALAMLQDAIQEAKAPSEPPFEPPADFPPEWPRWRRRENWRTAMRFPRVAAAMDWLDEMLRRVAYDIPPVSEAEYRELEAWFQANDETLSAKSQHGVLESVSLAEIRYQLAKGPRREGAGECAVRLRRLRAASGDPP